MIEGIMALIIVGILAGLVYLGVVAGGWVLLLMIVVISIVVGIFKSYPGIGLTIVTVIVVIALVLFAPQLFGTILAAVGWKIFAVVVLLIIGGLIFSN